MDEVRHVTPDGTTGPGAPPDGALRWTARKVHPIVLLWVALVFVAFMALSQFVFHSWTGVKALAIASVGFLVPLAATVTTRIEYRVTEAGLERRPLPRRRPGAFREVFRWDRLSEVVPVRYGIKFALRVDEPRPLQRFWKTHLSDAYSGEIHVEAEDRARVLRILAERGFVPAEPDGSDEPDEPA